MTRHGLLGCLLLAGFEGCTAQPPPSTNLGPTVYLVAPTVDDALPARRPVTVVAMVADDHEPAPELAVVVVVDGVVLARPTPTLAGRIEVPITVGPGAHTLTVTATDDVGLQGLATTPLTVDGAPGLTQPSVTIEPANAVTGDALDARLVVPATDPEGDPITYVWSWRADGSDAAVTTPSVDAGRVVEGEVWTVSVYATDGSGVSLPTSASVTILNAPPTPGDVVLSPESPTAADALTCSAGEPVDPEGDPFTSAWLWRVDDVDLGVDAPTLPAGTVHRGQTVRCGLAFSQDEHASVALSPSRTIGNAPPTAGGVAVAPDEPTAESGATCVVLDPADVDGDPLTLTYTWRVAGRPAGDTAVLDGTHYAHGQSIACVAQLGDPYGGGTLLESATVTAADTAPGSPEVAFATPTIVPGLLARCDVTVEATDVDGDALSYHWRWTADGVAVGNAPTLDTTGLVAGAVLTCAAAAWDGTLEGESAEASATIVAPTSGVVETGSAWATIGGSTDGGAFGDTVSAVGDIDGDGLGDLLVAAPQGAIDHQGAVYLYAGSALALGGTWTDTDAPLAWTGHAAGDQLGGALTGLGDLDGDALRDLGLGAPEAYGGAGVVYVRFGDAAAGGDIADSARLTIRGDLDTGLGTRVIGADLDGDGLDELGIGAPGGSGLLALWWGGAALRGDLTLADADVSITGASAGDALGAALAPAGDPDGDGYADLIVGFATSGRGGLEAGGAALLSGATLAPGTAGAVDHYSHLLVVGTTPGLRLGSEVAGPGDLDGDGVDDLAIAADGAGAVYLVYGVPGMNREISADDADLLIAGDGTGAELGAALGGNPGADLDGDGLIELIVGAPARTGGGPGAVYAGGGPALGWDRAYVGASAGDAFGASLTAGLDLDRDGFPDLVVGAPGVDGAAVDGGAVYLYRGP